jgi:hypothetical protein
LIKFLIENVMDQRVLRPATTLFATSNLEATGAWDNSAQDAPGSYVISVPAIGSIDSAVVSMKTPIGGTLRQFIYTDRGRMTIQVTYLSADQFGTFPL